MTAMEKNTWLTIIIILHYILKHIISLYYYFLHVSASRAPSFHDFLGCFKDRYVDHGEDDRDLGLDKAYFVDAPWLSRDACLQYCMRGQKAAFYGLQVLLDL